MARLRWFWSTVAAVALITAGGCGSTARPQQEGTQSGPRADLPRGLYKKTTEDGFDQPGAPLVSLEKALSAMPAPVSLPPESTVGKPAKVLSWGGDTPEGKRPMSMAVRYASGLTVVVTARRDLNGAFNEIRSSPGIVMSDGRQPVHLEEPPDKDLAASPKVEAYGIEGGEQLLAGGRTNHVRTQLVWNDANFTYEMVTKADTMSLDELRGLMRASVPGGQ